MRWESGGYSTTRNFEPCFGGGRRCGWPTVGSSLPALLAGVALVSQSSVTAVAPGPRSYTAGAGPSEIKMARPCALWPVTTRRMGRVMDGFLRDGRPEFVRLTRRSDNVLAAANAASLKGP